jgi:hypothetical protein
MQAYGGPYCGEWFTWAMAVMFWIYVGLGYMAAVAQYLSLFSAHPNRLTVQGMTPAWILPICMYSDVSHY